MPGREAEIDTNNTIWQRHSVLTDKNMEAVGSIDIRIS